MTESYVQRTYQVTGMTCEHCERAVREEVAALPGVETVQVSASSGRLEVGLSAPVDDAAVLVAVDEAGYVAVPS